MPLARTVSMMLDNVQSLISAPVRSTNTQSSCAPPTPLAQSQSAKLAQPTETSCVPLTSNSKQIATGPSNTTLLELPGTTAEGASSARQSGEAEPPGPLSHTVAPPTLAVAPPSNTRPVRRRLLFPPPLPPGIKVRDFGREPIPAVRSLSIDPAWVVPRPVIKNSQNPEDDAAPRRVSDDFADRHRADWEARNPVMRKGGNGASRYERRPKMWGGLTPAEEAEVLAREEEQRRKRLEELNARKLQKTLTPSDFGFYNAVPGPSTATHQWQRPDGRGRDRDPLTPIQPGEPLVPTPLNSPSSEGPNRSAFLYRVHREKRQREEIAANEASEAPPLVSPRPAVKTLAPDELSPPRNKKLKVNGDAEPEMSDPEALPVAAPRSPPPRYALRTRANRTQGGTVPSKVGRKAKGARVDR